MSATLRDVAKLAGVSASTVSRVINKSAPISGETTERIYRAMEELKYVPNDIARSFASGSARAIAIAVNVSDTRSYANRFFNNTVFGIETAAHRKGYNFIITSANDERGGMGSLEKLILSKKIDGLVLPVSLLQSSIVKLVEEMSFPFVVLGRVKNAGSRLSWVDISNEQAGAASVRYLLGKGYRRIGFLTRGDKELFTRDRLDGYRAELARAGLTPDPVYRVSPAAAFDETKLYLKTLFTSAAAPDAVICCDDKMALAALRGARELGIRVPEGLGILCFDNTEVTEMAELPISAVDVDTFELGRIAAETLFRQMEKPDFGASRSQITTKVIERGSTMKK